jgi:hypothetical protein
MPIFKKKTENKQERSKFVEPPKVFVSIERSIPLAPYNNYKINAGISIMTGDTLTIMKEGATTVQENETVANSFMRAFKATNDAIDREALDKGLKDVMDQFMADHTTPKTLPPVNGSTAAEVAHERRVSVLLAPSQPISHGKGSVAAKHAIETPDEPFGKGSAQAKRATTSKPTEKPAPPKIE